MSRSRLIALAISFLAVGVVVGGYLFKDTRPRSFLSLPNCRTCLSKSELAGLLTSVGIQKIPAVIPVVKETDKVIAIKSPAPLARIDYVVLPKKDIVDLGDLSPDDDAYITESFQVIAELIRENNLRDYKVISNGPGFQQINYLHFHLVAQ